MKMRKLPASGLVCMWQASGEEGHCNRMSEKRLVVGQENSIWIENFGGVVVSGNAKVWRTATGVGGCAVEKEWIIRVRKIRRGGSAVFMFTHPGVESLLMMCEGRMREEDCEPRVNLFSEGEDGMEGQWTGQS